MPVSIREPSTMPQAELAEIVSAVRDLVWGEPHWSEPVDVERRAALTFSTIANFLEGYGLGPEAPADDADAETCEECGRTIPADGPSLIDPRHATGCSLHPANCVVTFGSFLGICWGCQHTYRSDRPENTCPVCGKDSMEWS